MAHPRTNIEPAKFYRVEGEIFMTGLNVRHPAYALQGVIQTTKSTSKLTAG